MNIPFTKSWRKARRNERLAEAYEAGFDYAIIELVRGRTKPSVLAEQAAVRLNNDVIGRVFDRGIREGVAYCCAKGIVEDDRSVKTHSL